MFHIFPSTLSLHVVLVLGVPLVVFADDVPEVRLAALACTAPMSSPSCRPDAVRLPPPARGLACVFGHL